MFERKAKMSVTLTHWTGSLYPAFIAARVCYSKDGFKGIKPLKTEEAMGIWLRDKVLSRGHMSIIEQLDFQFIISGISRACSHQLVRHRIASYAQQSQRYVNKADFKYVTPHIIEDSARANTKYMQIMESLGKGYEELQNILCEEYPDLLGEKINQDARFILPNACETEITMKVNGRELIEMCKHRLCGRAQWEIREMFWLIREEVQKAVPIIFDNLGPTCRWQKCKEGGCKIMEPASEGWK